MNELIWLLLPLAAAAGWLMAKYHITFTHSFPFSSDYFKGLNYLLNEEPDKAIDIFIKLIEVDNETVETHLALGALFRRRGEVNRAIRIHHNLTTRTTLTTAQRSLAQLELALDYRRAGLLDRAENLFLELLNFKQHQALALQQLLDIYQQEHEWDKAIEVAKKLAKATSKTTHHIVAHYCCEQAEIYQQNQDIQNGYAKLAQALTTDPHCVRASLLEGQFALAQQDYVRAIEAFKRVAQQNPTYLTEVVESLQICYDQMGQSHEFVTYLEHLLDIHGESMPISLLFKFLQQHKSECLLAKLTAQPQPNKTDFVLNQLYKRSSLHGLNYLLDLMLSQDNSATREQLSALKNITAQLLKNKPAYRCYHCGFTSKHLHWQCPSCKEWASLGPIQDSEFD